VSSRASICRVVRDVGVHGVAPAEDEPVAELDREIVLSHRAQRGDRRVAVRLLELHPAEGRVERGVFFARVTDEAY